MTMAEKQYKNYDERFLKEDSSSSSRPVIEYVATNSDEVFDLDGINMALKGKFLDGSYCQNSDDLKKLFASGAIFSYTVPESETLAIYSPMMFSSKKSSSATITVDISGTTLLVVDAPTFEQLKQSKS